MKRIIFTALAALLCAAMLAAIPANADGDPFTIEGGVTEIGEGAKEATIDVYFRDVPSSGLCAVKFYVSVEGASFTAADVGPDMPGSFMRGELGGEKVSFLWVDIEKGVYEDVLAATFTVSLPEGLKEGDKIPVSISLDEDPDNYLSMATDAATGMNLNVTPNALDGKIVVISAAAAESKQAQQAAADPENKETNEPVASNDDPIAQTGADSAAASGKAEDTEEIPGRVVIGSAIGFVTADGSAADSTGSDEAKTSLPTGAIIGIACGAAAVIAAVCAIVVTTKKKKS